MKKLMVCGCSFSAPSHKPEYAGTAWGEVLAKKLGWDVQILARQGCSNGGIRIQIDEVIRQKPTFAIIVPTNYDRIEIPVQKDKLNFSNKNLWQKIQEFTQHTNDPTLIGYDPAIGLDNINYKNNDYRMIIETIHSLVTDCPHYYRKESISTNTQNAVKEYVNNLYDPNWKHQTDKWIIRDGLTQLKYHNIPFLVIPGTLLWSSVKELIKDLTILLDEKYLLQDLTLTPYGIQDIYPFNGKESNDYEKDPGYHTSPTGQEFLAETYYQLIKDRWNLV